jgi:hypothetical protein
MAQPARVDKKKKEKLSKDERRALKKQSRNPQAPDHHHVTDGRDGRRERSPDIEPGFAYHDKKSKGSRHSGGYRDERESGDSLKRWPGSGESRQSRSGERESSSRRRSKSPRESRRSRSRSPRASSRRSRSRSQRRS